MAPLTWAVLSVAGLVASFAVPHVSPARATGGVGSQRSVAPGAQFQTERLLRLAMSRRIFFWTIASLFAQNVLSSAKAVLHLWMRFGSRSQLLSVGIGCGAMLVGRLSQNRLGTTDPLGARCVHRTVPARRTDPTMFGRFGIGTLGTPAPFISYR